MSIFLVVYSKYCIIQDHIQCPVSYRRALSGQNTNVLNLRRTGDKSQRDNTGIEDTSEHPGGKNEPKNRRR
jgi:hypothetical protein